MIFVLIFKYYEISNIMFYHYLEKSENMVSWEYRIEKTSKTWTGKDKTDVDQLLNTIGRDGWELISVVPNTVTGSIQGYDLFFKRKRF